MQVSFMQPLILLPARGLVRRIDRIFCVITFFEYMFGGFASDIKFPVPRFIFSYYTLHPLYLLNILFSFEF